MSVYLVAKGSVPIADMHTATIGQTVRQQSSSRTRLPTQPGACPTLLSRADERQGSFNVRPQFAIVYRIPVCPSGILFVMKSL